MTALQQAVGTGVQTACVNITAVLGVQPNPNGTDVQKLASSCTKMVASAYGNQGVPLAPAYDLKISDSELATSTQALASVQSNAQKQIGRESSKSNMVSARLAGLRGGARGLVVGLNGAESKSAGLDGATGGAAAAGDIDGPWGGFVNIAYAWGNVDQTSLQDAYKYGSFAVLAGADYRVNDNFVAGAAFTYSDTHSDYDAGLGSVKAATIGVVGYATYYVDDWYVDGLLGYGSVGYDVTRNIDIPSRNLSSPQARPIHTSATSSPDGDQWSAVIGVGRNYPMGTWTVTPSARLGYIWVKNKAYSEYEPNDGLALALDERTIKSLQSALGAKASTVVNTASGVFGPYAAAYWMHEFENDSPSIRSKYAADPSNTFFVIPTAGPTRDYAILTLGSSATFPNSLSGFLQVSAAVGLKNETNYAAVLGIRKQF